MKKNHMIFFHLKLIKSGEMIDINEKKSYDEKCDDYIKLVESGEMSVGLYCATYQL